MSRGAGRGLAAIMLQISQSIRGMVMDVKSTAHEMNASQAVLSIPAKPNLVETAVLLEDPRLTASQRGALQRVLHDTVRLVKKQDGLSSSAAGGGRKTAVWA
jgi:hypothetical protein